MENLPLKLKKNGFVYKQVERDQQKAIYAQWDDGSIVAYEVFWIRRQKANSFKSGDKWIYKKAKELFPCNEDFGRTAWTFQKLSTARRHFNTMRKKKSGNA